MNKLLICLLPLLAFAFSPASAQRLGADFVIKKVGIEFISTPDYQFNGEKRHAENIGKWMEIETEFDAVPDFTEELTFNYFVQINNLLFVGEVTHVSIPKGRSHYSVMYISPRSLSQIMDGKVVTSSAIQRVSVQISKQGQLLSYGSWKNEASGWWTTMAQKTGFLLNKSETPFAPLYWDRYEAIKSSAH